MFDHVSVCVSQVNSDIEEANTLALKAAESVKEQRQERELQRRNPRPASIDHSNHSHGNGDDPPSEPTTPTATVPARSLPGLSVANVSHPHTPPQLEVEERFTKEEPEILVDEFTRVSVGEMRRR